MCSYIYVSDSEGWSKYEKNKKYEMCGKEQKRKKMGRN